MKKTLMLMWVLVGVFCALSPVQARSLNSALKNTLFAASVRESLFLTVEGRPVFSANPQRFGQLIQSGGPTGIARFFTRGLANEILTESATVPVPSGSPSFIYTYDPSLNIFQREPIGLGAIFNERVNTLGKGIFAFGTSYIRQDFNEFNGKDLSRLELTESLFAKQDSLGDFVGPESPGIVRASVDLNLITHTVALYGIYGLTDWMDVSVLLPITEVSLRAKSTLRQGGRTFANNLPVFTSDPLCTVERARQGNCRPADFTVLRRGTSFTFGRGDSSHKISRTRTGVGDLIIRTKARFRETTWGAIGGLMEVTFPTGRENNFLGDGAVKTRVVLLYSQGFLNNRLRFHLNGGSKFTTQTSDKNTIEYGSSVDFTVVQGFSLVGELIGSWRYSSGGLPENFIDGAFGFKTNPFGGFILDASFRIPATDDGLRSALTYLVGLEYDF